ncbi:hypothetical protein KKE06_04490 [Candidatus Micrarchaeota archaeon]|nr:hypothetical protein [Candidatus Micrarchaeota archaeon]MBU1930267.1 hypothetical protein [Candidatus Micrarchaeota archaeon]
MDWMIKASALFVLLVFVLPMVGAIPFEELPTGIEVKGLITQEEDVYCTAQTAEHVTLHYFEKDSFENVYTVTLFDKLENELGEFEFPFEIELYSSEEFVDDWVPFSLVLPFEEILSRIEITDMEGNVKCFVQKSEHKPEIEIIAPVNGENWNSIETIEWIMMDADTDDWLLVDVYWTDNSGLGWELLEQEADGLKLNLFEPIEATRIKVVVNDGFNSTEAIVESSLASDNIHANLDFYQEEVVRLTDPNQRLEASDLPAYSGTPPEPPLPPGPPPVKPPTSLDPLVYPIAGLIIVIIGLILIVRVKSPKGKLESIKIKETPKKKGK